MAGYSKKEFGMYYNVIELAKNALYDDEDFSTLKRLGKKAKNRLHDLEQNNRIGEKDMIKFLKYENERDYSYILRGLWFKPLDRF